MTSLERGICVSFREFPFTRFMVGLFQKTLLKQRYTHSFHIPFCSRNVGMVQLKYEMQRQHHGRRPLKCGAEGVTASPPLLRECQRFAEAVARDGQTNSETLPRFLA